MRAWLQVWQVLKGWLSSSVCMVSLRALTAECLPANYVIHLKKKYSKISPEWRKIDSSILSQLDLNSWGKFMSTFRTKISHHFAKICKLKAAACFRALPAIITFSSIPMPPILFLRFCWHSKILLQPCTNEIWINKVLF